MLLLWVQQPYCFVFAEYYFLKHQFLLSVLCVLVLIEISMKIPS